MTLRSFHLFFICIVVLFTLFFGAFEVVTYKNTKALSDAVVAGAAFASALGLSIYGIRFWLKGRIKSGASA